MDSVTAPGKKVKISEADLHDPKQLLKARYLSLYEQLNEVAPIISEAGKMNKKMEGMTQGELLSAIANEGDMNRPFWKNQKQPPGDPRTWKFEGRLQELLDAYSAKFVPEEPYLADDVERFCICNGPDDGRPMVQCSNGPGCLMNWFHLECIGMHIDEIPKEQEDWFCECCVDKNLDVLSKKGPKSIFKFVAKKSNADRIKHYEVREQAVPEATTKGDDLRRKKFVKNQTSRAKAKQKPKQMDLTIHTTSPKPLEMSSLSPGTPKPWTAELDKVFAEDPEVAETYGLGSLASAKVALRRRGTIATTNIAMETATIQDDSDFEMSQAASKPIHKRNKGSWTREEKDHLIACVTASQQANLRGEDSWDDVYPNMLARGVKRPVGGMKNTWLRGLREQTGVDERRRQNAGKMTTAVQKSKRMKEARKVAAEKAEMNKGEGDGVERRVGAGAGDGKMKQGEKKKMDAATALATMSTKPIPGLSRAESV